MRKKWKILVKIFFLEITLNVKKWENFSENLFLRDHSGKFFPPSPLPQMFCSPTAMAKN